jgi:hypothetical protein
MATVKRKVTETVEVTQEARNGSFITLFDLAEFGSDCADANIPGDVGIQSHVTEDGFTINRLRVVADIVTRDDDQTDPNGDKVKVED